MERSDRYRRFAAECLRLARVAGTEKDRLLMVSMAGGWLDLAERNEGGGASTPQDSPRKARRTPPGTGGTRH